MNGIEWLLDTNFILGLLKSSPETLAMIGDRQIDARRCGYSAITRMKLLGFPGLTQQEEQLISEKLACLVYLPLTQQIEDEAIHLRRNHRVKLPDAIIAASALVFGAEIVMHDKALHGIVAAERAAKVAARSHPNATA